MDEAFEETVEAITQTWSIDWGRTIEEVHDEEDDPKIHLKVRSITGITEPSSGFEIPKP
jgi:hypothetical protein